MNGDLTYSLIKKSLDAASLRQKVIAQNLANINTKGYKRYEVVFEDVLRDKLNANTHDVQNVEPKVIRDDSTSMRTDGNNVDIDFEMSNQAANDLLYSALVSQINYKMGIMKCVVTEGRE
ncbi:MAG TPA: flagellar basal body rod protein FlgB [Clostridiaceae bacterium]|nr:flagellar basal body rod protein FlgB [Clostridiaceae bacterium]